MIRARTLGGREKLTNFLPQSMISACVINYYFFSFCFSSTVSAWPTEPSARKRCSKRAGVCNWPRPYCWRLNRSFGLFPGFLALPHARDTSNNCESVSNASREGFHWNAHDCRFFFSIITHFLLRCKL